MSSAIRVARVVRAIGRTLLIGATVVGLVNTRQGVRPRRMDGRSCRGPRNERETRRSRADLVRRSTYCCRPVTAPGCAHLHVHSEYSLLDGACKHRALAERAASFGQPALGLTDHGVMNGAVELYKAAKKHGIKPIVGLRGLLRRRPPRA